MPDRTLNIQKLLKDLMSLQKKINFRYRILANIAVKANDIELKDILQRYSTKKNINNKAWKRLHRTSNSKIKIIDKMFTSLLKRLKEYNELLSIKNKLFDQLKSNHRPVQTLEDWSDRKILLIEELKNNNFDETEINNYIQNLEDFELNKFIDFQAKINDNQNKDFEKTYNKLLKAFMYHYFGFLCFKTNLNESDTFPLLTAKSKFSFCSKTIAENYNKVKSGLTMDDESAYNQSKDSESRLRSCLEVELLPLALSLYKTKITSKKELESKIDISIQTGMLIRKSLLLLSACKRLQFDYINNDYLDQFKSWRKSSNISSIESKQKIDHISLRHLSERGENFDDKQIRIRGKVLSVKIIYVRNKPISNVFIKEEGFIVQATIPYLKIDTSGITPGTYLEITGKWLEENKEAFNKPALAISRINNSQESKYFWISWLTLEMNNVFQYIPHSINANYSWKPGLNGAINQIKYFIY